ncbi:MAG: phosphoribosylglycinamide formyltransferase [Proteobacteria bacterium]|nr:phosphoribosylglycinamide formyltransferase [Pseudomonadota bacterium]
MKTVVFISGRGSNLQALLKDQSGYEINHVFSDRKSAYGLEIAKKSAVNNSYINWKNKQQAENRTLKLLESIRPDLIVLAGFMQILSTKFIACYPDSIINIHPSLLPAYPGLNTHQRALDAGELMHGASVHLVDEKLDHGPVIAQTLINILNKDTAETLAEKTLEKEHKLLPFVVGLMASDNIQCSKNRVIFNGQTLTQPITY